MRTEYSVHLLNGIPVIAVKTSNKCQSVLRIASSNELQEICNERNEKMNPVPPYDLRIPSVAIT